ncbi:hypothetical protein [Arthrobacter sp. G119Y2]
MDHFAAKTCCFMVTADDDGGLRTYAPFGYRALAADHSLASVLAGAP